MRRLSAIVLIFCQCKILSSESLFLNETENQIVSKHIESKPKTEQKNKSDHFKLTGIIYQDPEHWTVWINDIPYNTIGTHLNFSIDEVLSDRAFITDSHGNTIVLKVE